MNAIAFPIVATHTTTPCSLAHATTWSFNVASGCCFARARSHSIFILCLRAAGRRSGITPPVSRNKRSTRLTVDVLTEKCLAVEAYVDLAFRRWCSTIRVRRSLLSRGVGIGRLNQLFYGVSTTFFGSHQLVTGLVTMNQELLGMLGHAAPNGVVGSAKHPEPKRETVGGVACDARTWEEPSSLKRRESAPGICTPYCDLPYTNVTFGRR